MPFSLSKRSRCAGAREGGRQTGHEAHHAAVGAEGVERQGPRALPVLLQLSAQGLGQGRQGIGHALGLQQGIGEGLPDAVVGRWAFGLQRFGLGAQGLVEATDQGQALIASETARQATARQGIEVADPLQAEAGEQAHGLGLQAQGLHRQVGQGFARPARRSVDRGMVRGRRPPGQGEGRARGVSDGGAGGDAGRFQPPQDLLQQGRLAAEQMGAAGHVDQQALSFGQAGVHGHQRREALEPEGQGFQRPALLLRLGRGADQSRGDGAGVGVRLAGVQAEAVAGGAIDGVQHHAPAGAVHQGEGLILLLVDAWLGRLPARRRAARAAAAPDRDRPVRQPDGNDPSHDPAPEGNTRSCRRGCALFAPEASGARRGRGDRRGPAPKARRRRASAGARPRGRRPAPPAARRPRRGRRGRRSPGGGWRRRRAAPGLKLMTDAPRGAGLKRLLEGPQGLRLAPGADQEQAGGVEAQAPRAPAEQASAFVVEQRRGDYRHRAVVAPPFRRLDRPRQGEGQGGGEILGMGGRRLLERLRIRIGPKALRARAWSGRVASAGQDHRRGTHLFPICSQ